MPYCTSCGTKAAEDHKFCTRCGRQFTPFLQQRHTNEASDKKAWLLQQMEAMQPNATCAYCANRIPKKVCGSQQSPYSGTEINLDDKCDFYTYNPAQLDYAKALFLDRYDEKAGIDIHETVRAFRKAIVAGLPADDELNARFCIAKCLVLWMGDQDLDPLKRSKLLESKWAIEEFESALALDCEGGFKFFEDERGRLLLSQLDLMYVVEGSSLSIERGHGGVISDAAAIEYWEKKLPNCEYLSTNPLISTLVEAGYAYSRLENKQAAIRCFRRAIEAAPVDISDHRQNEVDRQNEARACLKELTQRSESE